MARIRLRACPLAVVLICGVGCAPAPGPRSLQGASGKGTSLPGVVADTHGERIYTANVDGGIDALDLETGRCLWSTASASIPLAVGDGTLAAQTAAEGSSLRIAVLDVNQEGKLLWRSDPVTFPDWVSVGPAPGQSFTSEGRIDEGDLLLKWEARTRPGGANHTGREKVESGIAWISLKTGTFSMLPPEKGPAIPTVRLPEALADYALGSWPNGSALGGAVVSGDLLVALEKQHTGEAAPPRKEATAKEELSRLLLRRWHLANGEPLEPVELCKNLSFWVILLPREGYVLVNPGVLESAPSDEYFKVCSIRTGQRMGKFPYIQDMQAVSVVGTRGYAIWEDTQLRGPLGHYTFPRTLKVIDLGSGKQLWERAIAGRRENSPPP